jgi:hypothetical protein
MPPDDGSTAADPTPVPHICHHLRVTAIRNAMSAALLAGAVALAGVTACASSSGSPASGGSSLDKKWSEKLSSQMSDADKECTQPISADCVNNVEAVMVILGNIRKDVPSESASGKYAGLTAALDQADQDHQKFSRAGCGAGGNQMNCTLLVTSISQDVTNVLNQLSGA